MQLAVDIAQIIVAVGVLAALAGLRQAQRQRIRTFEDFYVRRYWQLMDQLTLDAVRDRVRRICPHDEKTIRSYLALCEDELELRQGGWISDATWEVWQSGIHEQLKRHIIRRIWVNVRSEAERGMGQPFVMLRSFEAAPTDPIKLGPLRRRWRGLHGVPWEK